MSAMWDYSWLRGKMFESRTDASADEICSKQTEKKTRVLSSYVNRLKQPAFYTCALDFPP